MAGGGVFLGVVLKPPSASSTPLHPSTSHSQWLTRSSSEGAWASLSKVLRAVHRTQSGQWGLSWAGHMHTRGLAVLGEGGSLSRRPSVGSEALQRAEV